MKLPNALSAVVDREKIVDYLLNPAHPDNGGKAPFFLTFGFSREDWQKLVAAFRELARVSPVTVSLESPHGMKYIIDGQIETPSGRRPVVRTVWVVDLGFDLPRLVTAYPHED